MPDYDKDVASRVFFFADKLLALDPDRMLNMPNAFYNRKLGVQEFKKLSDLLSGKNRYRERKAVVHLTGREYYWANKHIVGSIDNVTVYLYNILRKLDRSIFDKDEWIQEYVSEKYSYEALLLDFFRRIREHPEAGTPEQVLEIYGRLLDLLDYYLRTLAEGREQAMVTLKQLGSQMDPARVPYRIKVSKQIGMECYNLEELLVPPKDWEAMKRAYDAGLAAMRTYQNRLQRASLPSEGTAAQAA